MGFYLLFGLKRFDASNRSYLIYYLCCITVGFLTFCTLFRWQPWNTRYHLPFFISAIPLISYFIHDLFNNKKKGVKYSIFSFIMFIFLGFGFVFINSNIDAPLIILLILLPLSAVVYFMLKNMNKLDILLPLLMLLLILFSFPYVFFFKDRPLLYKKTIFLNQWEYKYFNAYPPLGNQYVEVADLLQKFQVDKAAVDLEGYGREYPLWPLLRKRIANIEIRHIGFPKKHEKLGNFKKDYQYRAVITHYDNTVHRFDRDNVLFYKVFGTTRRDLRLIVLKKAVSKKLHYRKKRGKND